MLCYSQVMEMDTERLDWLDADSDRLEDVRNRMNDEEETVREAIDALAAIGALMSAIGKR